jgi:hypothetical protein
VRALAGGVVLPLMLAACVHTEERREPYSKTALMVSRDSSGTTLQWKSKKDVRYTILYRDGKANSAVWQALPSATELVGTGGTMTAKDNSPGAFYRSYRPQALLSVPASKIPTLTR